MRQQTEVSPLIRRCRSTVLSRWIRSRAPNYEIRCKVPSSETGTTNETRRERFSRFFVLPAFEGMFPHPESTPSDSAESTAPRVSASQRSGSTRVRRLRIPSADGPARFPAGTRNACIRRPEGLHSSGTRVDDWQHGRSSIARPRDWGIGHSGVAMNPQKGQRGRTLW